MDQNGEKLVGVPDACQANTTESQATPLDSELSIGTASSVTTEIHQDQVVHPDTTHLDHLAAAAARIVDLEEQVVTLRNDYLRALADAQNVQVRADRRIELNMKYAITSFVKDLVMVADNLSRALQHVPAEARTSDELLNSLATGVEMTEQSLLILMERNGLRRLNPLDQPFDPNLHHAVQETENKLIPTGTVIQVLQEGYVLHDRLIRPATVVVARGGPKRQQKSSQPSSQESPLLTAVPQPPSDEHLQHQHCDDSSNQVDSDDNQTLA